MQSRTESGFSLIEVMITSFILAVGLLGIVALQGIAKKSLADTDKQIQASFLARTALEELRADTRWLTANSIAAQNTVITDILTNAASSVSLNNMALCRNITGLGSGTVTFAVSWQIQNAASSSGAANGAACGQAVDNRRQVVLTSLISEAI
ncbi:MAG: hypothetical protein COA76_10300 [Moritella sp.]|uniref:prepilin-type N-terminal cleavage/methylation domain-containing protein n=1 Tax=Moritella sp. TaxID=78556 RepID=UPI000C0C8F9E|nr:prepilin-type N-terminal cleavage/methylation domain-containing protein [Moritella sp.]MBL1415702.1 prepilin-type N-terminal cleavage/methylation domain-containing protein [Moritella sp.]PHR87720.1 MAG: hypothetical protein COA76_10300 [Moritella sp.]